MTLQKIMNLIFQCAEESFWITPNNYSLYLDPGERERELKVSWVYSFLMKQERKTFIRSEAITMSCMIVIPENHSTRDENDYVIS